MKHSVYLHNPPLEILGILSPPIVVTLAVLLLYGTGSSSASNLSPWMWLVFVLGIDVAHVWSTLFRTYLHRRARTVFRVHLIVIPLLTWVFGVLLYSVGAGVFWSLFAYLAVFHFIRQQYGFFALYARSVHYASPWLRSLDAAVVYLAALYPLAYWHLHLPRNIDWFVDGDFILPISEPTVGQWGGCISFYSSLRLAMKCYWRQ
jgi:hypothetical protein